MNKLLPIVSFLFLLIYTTFQSWALPSCAPFPPYDNCYGSHTFKSGNIYEGEWKDNKRNGQGIATFTNGDKYVGEWKDNKRNGQGIATFANGNIYEGEFKNGEYHGQGIIIFKSGNKYAGEFKNSKRHGKGTFTFANGDQYIGEFKNGKFNGQGTFSFINGVKDVGKFKNGKLNGFAIRYDKKGNILKKGIWRDDKFLYSEKGLTSPSSNSKLNKYKHFCESIGFTLGTEKFAECVVEAMKKG